MTDSTPTEIRDDMLQEHAEISAQLLRLEHAAQGLRREPALRERVAAELRRLRSLLFEHMRHEEEVLLPELAQLAGFGAVRVADVKREHAIQRQVLDAVVHEALQMSSCSEFAGNVQGLIDGLREEMQREEQTHFRMLSDGLSGPGFIG